MSRIAMDIRRTAKNAVHLPFDQMAAAALPAGYHLSLVICGDALARKMNRKYRNKTYAPNVLSFPLSNSEGEIFLNLRKAAREAREEKIALKKRLALLFVHGCVHLAGHDHGSKMELLEGRILKKFGY